MRKQTRKGVSIICKENHQYGIEVGNILKVGNSRSLLDYNSDNELIAKTAIEEILISKQHS